MTPEHEDLLFNLILIVALPMATIGSVIKFKGGVIDRLAKFFQTTPPAESTEPPAEDPSPRHPRRLPLRGIPDVYPVGNQASLR